MESNRKENEWVDKKMAALEGSGGLDDRCWRQFRRRRREHQAHMIRIVVVFGIVLTGLAIAATAPGTKAFAYRCVDACIGIVSGVRGEGQLALEKYRGQVLVLNFWATWCPPCREELPSLDTLQARYQENGVAVVGVSMDEGDFDAVRQFWKRQKLGFELMPGTETIAQQFGGIDALPVTILFDRKGNEISRHKGKVDPQDMEQRVRAALNLK